MKIYKVYEIRNTKGIVEYVGETSRELKDRFKQHTKKKPGSGCGKFYKRQDVTIHEVTRFDNRKEALKLEGILKLRYGLEWSERNGSLVAGKMSRKLSIEQAEEIRRIYANGNISQRKLAEQYGISQRSVCCIINKKSYNIF